MSDVLDKLTEASSRLEAAVQERATLLKDAEALEEQARNNRRKAQELKTEISQLHSVIGSYRVQKAVESTAQAAEQSKAAALANEKKTAETLAEVEKMKKELQEMLDKQKSTTGTSMSS